MNVKMYFLRKNDEKVGGVKVNVEKQQRKTEERKKKKKKESDRRKNK